MIALDLRGQEWRLDSACGKAVERGEAEHHWWWPRTTDERRSDNTRAALLICDSCPVKDPCLEAAEDDDPRRGVDGGIRGGLTGRTRTKRRARQEQAVTR